MGGKPDWMYTKEREHYANTLKERWADGCWTNNFEDISKVKWLKSKQNGIFPDTMGYSEALCFDEDTIAEIDDVCICIWQNGNWKTGIRFCGIPQPYVMKD